MRTIKRAVSLAPGELTLCCSSGQTKLPVLLANAGQLVVVLENGQDSAAALLEEAHRMKLASQLQIYLKEIDDVIRDSLDQYHLMAFSSSIAINTSSKTFERLLGRLVHGGVVIVHKTHWENVGPLKSRLINMGLDVCRVDIDWKSSNVVGRLWDRITSPSRRTVSIIFKKHGKASSVKEGWI